MEYLVTLAILGGINVILASSFNLILGYGGLVSVAHPIFFALGAYTSALLARDLGVPIPIAILAGAALAALFSAALSIPALRVSGDYLVITSLGVQLGLLHIIQNLELTGAMGGLANIPAAFEGEMRSIWFLGVVIVVAAVSVALVRWLMHGDYGRAVTAMRNDEDALAALGRSPIAIKVALFALGCGLAGVAGGLYAHHYLYLAPEQFGIFASAAILTMVVVGGAARPGARSWRPHAHGGTRGYPLPRPADLHHGAHAGRGVFGTGPRFPVHAAAGPAGWRACRRRPRQMDAGPVGAAMTRTVLSIEGLTKRFGGIVVADGLSLSLEAGDIVGLIGPNGAGKTSLFNLVTGFVPADAGTITVSDQRIDGMRPEARARAGIARTWQNGRIFGSLTVLDNLMIGARDYPGERIVTNALLPGRVSVARKEAAARAREVLVSLRMDHMAGSPAAELSFGQQKLVAIGRALMNQGDVLLLDEPMAGVAGHIYETIADVIRAAAAAGMAICLVEHNVGFVRDLCSRGIFMFAGEILADGPVDTLIADRRLTELYFGAAA